MAFAPQIFIQPHHGRSRALGFAIGSAGGFGAYLDAANGYLNDRLMLRMQASCRKSRISPVAGAHAALVVAGNVVARRQHRTHKLSEGGPCAGEQWAAARRQRKTAFRGLHSEFVLFLRTSGDRGTGIQKTASLACDPRTRQRGVWLPPRLMPV